MRRKLLPCFTLIELIVVMAIMMILASGTLIFFSEAFAGNRGETASLKLHACLREARNLVVEPTHFLAVEQSVSHIHLYDTDDDGYYEAFAAHNGFRFNRGSGAASSSECAITEEESQSIIYYMPPETAVEIPRSSPVEKEDTDYPIDKFWFCGMKMRNDSYKTQFYSSAIDSEAGISYYPIQAMGVCYVYDKKLGKRLYRVVVNFYTDSIRVINLED